MRDLAQHREAFLGLVLGAQDVGEQQLRQRELRAQRQRDAVVQQRQIDRLGLVQHAGQIEHRRGEPVGGEAIGGFGGPAARIAATAVARSLLLFCWMKRS